MKHPEISEKLLATLERLLSTPLSEMMDGLNRRPVMVEHDTPLEELFSLLADDDHLWVKGAGDSGVPAGLVTRRDVLSSFMPPRSGYAGLKSARETSVARGTADCASCYIRHKHFPVCGKDDSVAELVRRAVRSGETVVAVVDEGRFLGELGIEDLLKKLLAPAGKE